MTKMRLLAAALTACAVASASASLEAAVYVLDSDLAPSYRGPSITTQNAQLWLAYRLGLSSFYSVSEADDETFSLLNRFGDEAQATLFTPSEPNPRKLVVVEGVENPQAFFRDEKLIPAFHISLEPSSFETAHVITSLLSQDRFRRGAHQQCIKSSLKDSEAAIWGGFSTNDPVGTCTFSTDAADSYQESNFEELKVVRGGIPEMMDVYRSKGLPPSVTSDYTSILHVSILNRITQRDGMNISIHHKAAAELKRMVLSRDYRQQTTIICFPSSTHNVKRSVSNDEPSEFLPVVDLRKEQPLSRLASTATSQQAQSAKPSNSTVPKTTIPSCYSNEAACLSSTANCAGHGACRKKYTEKVSKDEEGPECWACLCEPMKILTGDRVKTIYWGGPACQKKDISVPFLLFAGFTVAALTAISSAIGLLYSVGEEDLPSVLGAGVAPTVRR